MTMVRVVAHFTFDIEVENGFDEYDESELESFGRDIIHDMTIEPDDYVYEILGEV